MPSKSVTEAQLRIYKAEALKAERQEREANARRANLISDEIEHEMDRKRASSDEARVFPFYAQVGASSVRAALEMIGEWARLEEPKDTQDRPFTIEITSPGGSVFDGLALIDYVRKLRSEGYRIDTHGSGLIASMATFLLQAGEHRTLGANSWFMVHEISDVVVGNVSEVKDAAEVNDRINDKLLSLLAERSTLSLKQIKRKSERKDWYLDADEAVTYGFADEVV
jgi:ATP-dependent Clp endopeptidase proteolytic subunit ClpP